MILLVRSEPPLAESTIKRPSQPGATDTMLLSSVITLLCYLCVIAQVLCVRFSSSPSLPSYNFVQSNEEIITQSLFRKGREREKMRNTQTCAIYDAEYNTISFIQRKLSFPPPPCNSLSSFQDFCFFVIFLIYTFCDHCHEIHTRILAKCWYMTILLQEKIK